MSRPRVSIAGLMAIVLLCGIGVAAARSASPLWAGAMLAATLGMMGTAILGAIYREARRRAFWVGFALFGWGYLILAFGPWFATEVRPTLATSIGIDALHARLHPAQAAAETFASGATWTQSSAPAGAVGTIRVQGNVQLASPAAGSAGPGWSQPSGSSIAFFSNVQTAGPNQEEFRRIGHALSALIAALVGGIVARRFASGSREDAGPADALA